MGSAGKIRILIADDHTMFREVLSDFLSRLEDMEVVATACDGREALQKTRETKPDVAVLDWFMPLLNGLDATRQIASLKNGSKVILLSGYHEDRFIVESIRVGAKAYLRKEEAIYELTDALRQVARGGTFIYRDYAAVIAHTVNHSYDVPKKILTSREREVLQLIAEGRSNKEIATVLGITPRTAVHHRENIMRKLNIHTVAGLTLYAVRQGIVQP